MDETSFRRGIQSAITILILVSVCVSPVTAVTFTDSTQTTTEQVSDSQFIKASDSVSVWRNAPFPLRVNASASNGTVIENQQVTVFAQGQGAEVRLNKQQLAAFNPNEEIEMSFKSRFPITTRSFGNQEVQLLAVKAGPNSSKTLLGSEPTTSGIIDTLTNAKQSENVSFELEDVGNLRRGAITTSYDLSKSGPARGPGQYVFLLVQDTEGEGFEVNDGSLSVDGNARVIGMDVALVQAAEASATSTTENPMPGDRVSFDVNSTFEHSNVSHAVVMYNESQYTDAMTRIRVNGSLDRNFSTDQVQVTSTLVGVNGSVNVSEDVTVGGVTLGDGEVRTRVRFASLADWIVERANPGGGPPADAGPPEDAGPPADAGNSKGGGPPSDAGPPDDAGPPSREGQWLDASVTAINSQDGTKTVHVVTGDDWDNGTYRYIYLAQARGQNNLSTMTGTVELGNETET